MYNSARGSVRASFDIVMVVALAVAGCDPSVGSGGDASDASVASVDSGSGDLAGDGPRSADLAMANGPCPNLLGKYAVSATGQGCGDLSENAPECIIGNVTTCVAQLQSGPEGLLGAVRGTAMIQVDGSFSGASLQLGTVDRSGCTGTWDALTSTLVVDCGGVGSSQSCVVTLTRTATSCP